MNLGEKLIKYRKEKSLTQEDVSKKLGVPKSKISKWERNELYPEIDDIVSLCNLYEVTPNDLLSNNKKNIKKDDEKNKRITKLIVDEIITIVTVVVYLFVSFLTNAWHITWIIWIIYVLALEVVKLIFHLKGIDFEDE